MHRDIQNGVEVKEKNHLLYVVVVGGTMSVSCVMERPLSAAVFLQ